MGEAQGRGISRSASPLGLLILFISAVLVSTHLCHAATHVSGLHGFLEQEGERACG